MYEGMYVCYYIAVVISKRPAVHNEHFASSTFLKLPKKEKKKERKKKTPTPFFFLHLFCLLTICLLYKP